ncbi:MAG: response regulator [Pseudomonadota bacterium]|jgi:two-component system OmpR family response regulator
MTPLAGNELRVLLVEDSPRIAERVRELLVQEEGVRVLETVADERSALRALTEQAVDVLILDLQLKVGTGFGVLEALGSHRPMIIVMTNYALPQYRERARQLGVEHFLNKAMDFERLSDIMAEMRSIRDAAN